MGENCIVKLGNIYKSVIFSTFRLYLFICGQ